MTFLAVLATAFLNRFRGGGYGAERLPGHPRYYVILPVFLIAYAIGGPRYGALVAVSYLAWSLLPWGRWYTLDFVSSSPAYDRKPSWFERTVERFTGTQTEAFYLRQLIGFVPASILISPFALLASVAVVAVYQASWMLAPKNPITVAELLTGAIWGVLIIWGQ